MDRLLFRLEVTPRSKVLSVDSRINTRILLLTENFQEKDLTKDLKTHPPGLKVKETAISSS
jgi:hypothetical protein